MQHEGPSRKRSLSQTCGIGDIAHAANVAGLTNHDTIQRARDMGARAAKAGRPPQDLRTWPTGRELASPEAAAE